MEARVAEPPREHFPGSGRQRGHVVSGRAVIGWKKSCIKMGWDISRHYSDADFERRNVTIEHKLAALE